MSDSSNTPPSQDTQLSYKSAGVDIDAGEVLVQRIKSSSQKTRRPETIGGLGGFGALCRIPKGYHNPILVSGTDGVGTKLKLATDLNRHDTIGIDLVAMCVNDLLVCGAKPLFFLDYYATGKLNVDTAASVVEGIAEGCLQAECSLSGGETAEMPGMYQGEDYDLAGFCVGVVEEDKLITGKEITVGDAIIALSSSGAHSNGYSLIRKVLEVSGVNLATATLDTDINTNTDNDNNQPASQLLADVLLTPTKIYVKTIHALLKTMSVHGMAHITGGGLTDNIPRILDDNLAAQIDTSSWQMPPLFSWLQQQGNIATQEMYRTFNCGVGFVVVVPTKSVDDVMAILTDQGEQAWQIGEIIRRETDAVVYR